MFAPLLGDNTLFSETRHDDDRSRDAVSPILQRLVDADFAAVEIGFYAQCWACFSKLDVDWSETLLFIFNWQKELRKSHTGADFTLSDIRVQTGSGNIVTLSALWPTSSKST